MPFEDFSLKGIIFLLFFPKYHLFVQWVVRNPLRTEDTRYDGFTKKTDCYSATAGIWICHHRRCGGIKERYRCRILSKDGANRHKSRKQPHQPGYGLLPTLWLGTDTDPRKKAHQVLLGQMQTGLVERSPGKGQPQGCVLVHLRPLWKALHRIRQCRAEILLPLLLHC